VDTPNNSRHTVNLNMANSSTVNPSSTVNNNMVNLNTVNSKEEDITHQHLRLVPLLFLRVNTLESVKLM
jgi:hypothetical protein